jgi:hypothetical protein
MCRLRQIHDPDSEAFESQRLRTRHNSDCGVWDGGISWRQELPADKSTDLNSDQCTQSNERSSTHMAEPVDSKFSHNIPDDESFPIANRIDGSDSD